MFKEFFWTWIPWIFNKASYAVDTGRTILRVIYNELTQKKEFVFLHNNHIPVSSQLFGPIEDVHVKWRCSLNPSIFIEPGFQFEEERHLSYLGFVIKVPSTTGTKEIDISDWVNELKWKGAITTNNEPTLKEIVVLWSFSSGESYLHCLNEIYVEYINSSGESYRKGLNES
jgi:hypothetical protein